MQQIIQPEDEAEFVVMLTSNQNAIALAVRAWASALARFEVLNFRKQQAGDARLKISDELEHIIVAETAGIDDRLLSQ